MHRDPRTSRFGYRGPPFRMGFLAGCAVLFLVVFGTCVAGVSLGSVYTPAPVPTYSFIKADESDWTADEYFSAAGDHLEEGRYQQAIDNYTAAIRLDPQYVNAYVMRGLLYRELGQYQQAIRDYDEAIRLNPQYVVNAYVMRGLLYRELGQYQQAIRDYDEAIRLDPQDTYGNRGDAYYNRGAAYYILGQYGKAIEDFNEAIRLDPQNEDAKKNKAMVEAFLKGN